MQNNEIKNFEDIINNKDVFIQLGWIVQEYEPCLLMYKMDINKHSGAFFISKSLRIEPDFKMIGYKFMKKMFEIRLKSFSLCAVVNKLQLLDKDQGGNQVETKLTNSVLDCIPPTENIGELFEESDQTNYEVIEQELYQVVVNSRFVCQICKRTYHSKGACKTHFISKHQLDHQRNEHFKETNGIRRRKNLIFVRSFAKKQKLMTQIATEDDSKNKVSEREDDNVVNNRNCHVCKICKRGFSQNSGLSLHINIKHKEHQPHKCHLCPKKFEFNYHLNAHLKYDHCQGATPAGNSIDSGNSSEKMVIQESSEDQKVLTQIEPDNDVVLERKYFCKICDRTFTRRSSLTQHKNIKHVKSHQCTDCSQKFNHRFQLTLHQKYEHCKEKPVIDSEPPTSNGTVVEMDINGTTDIGKITAVRTPAKKYATMTPTPPKDGVNNNDSLTYELHSSNLSNDNYTCQICQKRFTSVDHLIKHNLAHKFNVALAASSEK